MSRRLLLRLLTAAPATDHVSDAELLRRFVASNDPAALELVVRRHADAVWAACRRLLRSDADVEDAFQATFLALLRKARDVRLPCAGGWLHRVAVNVSLKVRERNARTSTAEPGTLEAIPAAHAEPLDVELGAVVHEELARLSDRERLPVVLCDLEGLSHADAAKVLGWPIGTVSGRLSRARAKLRERLARRGLKPSGAALPALFVPSHLILKVLSLPAGAPPAVVSLTEGVLAMSATASWKWVAAAVVCAGALGAGGVLALTPDGPPVPLPVPAPAPVPLAANDPGPQPKGKPADDDWVAKRGTDGVIKHGAKAPPSAFPELVLPEPEPDDKDGKKRLEQFEKVCPRLTGKTALVIEPADDTLRKVLKARLHQGTLEFQLILERSRIARAELCQLTTCELLSDIRDTATELWGGRPKELLPWLEELVVVTKEIERVSRVRVLNGTAPPHDLNAATRHRLAMEAALLKAKGKP